MVHKDRKDKQKSLLQFKISLDKYVHTRDVKGNGGLVKINNEISGNLMKV